MSRGRGLTIAASEMRSHCSRNVMTSTSSNVSSRSPSRSTPRVMRSRSEPSSLAYALKNTLGSPEKVLEGLRTIRSCISSLIRPARGRLRSKRSGSVSLATSAQNILNMYMYRTIMYFCNGGSKEKTSPSSVASSKVKANED